MKRYVETTLLPVHDGVAPARRTVSQVGSSRVQTHPAAVWRSRVPRFCPRTVPSPASYPPDGYVRRQIHAASSSPTGRTRSLRTTITEAGSSTPGPETAQDSTETKRNEAVPALDGYHRRRAHVSTGLRRGHCCWYIRSVSVLLEILSSSTARSSIGKISPLEQSISPQNCPIATLLRRATASRRYRRPTQSGGERDPPQEALTVPF
ncbi:MAG: hypothetical protein A07HB70_00308 [uncultured archaeon A07HB70]|nr:MAG: hypothetical protein A07HB70_00308 [uncultured archaeon A07HB70]